MSTTVCPLNPPGHGWEAGLSCRWCDATRTPGEAVLSGLASVRGWSREAARTVRDAHRAEILAEAKTEVVAWLDKKAYEGTPATELASKVERGAIRLFIGIEREEATAAAATATPDFFQPRHTYTVRGFAYRCENTTTHPAKNEREAWGWLHRGGDLWRLERLYDADYTADVAQSGADRD